MTSLSQTITQARNTAETVCNALGGDAYIVYVTSSREPANVFGGSIQPDILPKLTTQLKALPKRGKLILFLQTFGGDLSAPWPIVSLLREYCTDFTVVVLQRALSAGTLISMGADSIVMAPDAFLSPVDPQAQLMIKGEAQSIGVEDVTGYIEFIKTRVGLSGGAGLEKAFESLTQEIQPTTIGSLYRTHALIRSLASKMLDTRKTKFDTASEKQIVESLTEKLFSHNHLISRKEAKFQVGLGSTIVFPDDATCKKLDQLSGEITTILKLDHFFDPVSLVGDDAQYEEEITKVLLFSKASAVAFKSKVTIVGASTGQGAINVNDLGWVKG